MLNNVCRQLCFQINKSGLWPSSEVLAGVTCRHLQEALPGPFVCQVSDSAVNLELIRKEEGLCLDFLPLVLCGNRNTGSGRERLMDGS